jgi:hypothetical protein
LVTVQLTITSAGSPTAKFGGRFELTDAGMIATFETDRSAHGASSTSIAAEAVLSVSFSSSMELTKSVTTSTKRLPDKSTGTVASRSAG